MAFGNGSTTRPSISMAPSFLGMSSTSRNGIAAWKRVLAPGARETAQPTGRTSSLRRRGPAHQTLAEPDNLPPPTVRPLTIGEPAASRSPMDACAEGQVTKRGGFGASDALTGGHRYAE